METIQFHDCNINDVINKIAEALKKQDFGTLMAEEILLKVHGIKGVLECNGKLLHDTPGTLRENKLLEEAKALILKYDLKKEYEELKTKLFGDGLGGECAASEYDQNNPDWIRYNQLFGFYKPEFRTKNWIDPTTLNWGSW